MKYQVRISERAEQDVAQILVWFVEQRALDAGGRWHDQLLAKVTTLEQNPERCSLADEAEELGIDVRELLFGRRKGMYRILFWINGKRVEILRIRHASRDSLSAEEFFR